MKKMIFLIAAAMPYAGAIAQIGFAPEVGVGASNMRFIPDNVFTGSSQNSQFSWRAGVILDAPFTQHIYFQSGLYWSRKGHNRNYSFRVSDSTYDHEDRTFTLNYVDLPLNVVFKTAEQGKGRFCLGAGAMMSYLIAGHVKGTSMGKYNDTAFNNTISASAGEVLRKFDIGVSFFSAYEFPGGLYLRVYYISGVKDIGTLTEVSKNRMWGIGAGYYFGKNRNANKDTEGLIDKSKE